MNQSQERFISQFLSPFKQRLYFARNLPMAIIAGIKLIELGEERSVAKVPYRWWNKNPFASMYFAVQSMAAELSTAAPAMLAIKGVDYKVALIIVDMSAEFSKKAKTKIEFTCTDGKEFGKAVETLQEIDETISVTAQSIGKDTFGEEVAKFKFTWSYKRLS